MMPNFNEGAWWWGGLSPDRIAFRIHASLLNLARIQPFRCRGLFTITNAGGEYWDFSLHAEALLPGQPLLPQVASWLASLALQGVFIDPLASYLVLAVRPDWDWASILSHIVYTQMLEDWGFRMVDLEVAMDFPVRERPFRLKEKAAGKKFRSTRYSPDAVTYRRLVRLPDGTQRFESKGHRKSLVAEYDRAKKIGVAGDLWRVELRLQRHHLDRLGPYELALDFYRWLCLRLGFLGKITRKAIKPGSWTLRPETLATQPIWVRILAEEVGWR